MSYRETALFCVFGILWVGGGGFVFYRWPDFLVRVNERFRCPKWLSPSVRFIRWMGIIEMILAALSLLNLILMIAFRPEWLGH
jgi:hypothetical protein